MNLKSISDTIFTNLPELSAEQKDDILALLEELEKRYTSTFFLEKLTVANAMRLTGLKYITARDVLMEMTRENVHDILALHPILEMQEPVFKKLDLLKEIKNRFPNYPETNLTAEKEKALIIQIMDFSIQEVVKFSLMPQTSIGSFISKNPRLFYFFL